MVNMTPAVPALTAEPPINGNGATNGHSGMIRADYSINSCAMIAAACDVFFNF